MEKEREEFESKSDRVCKRIKRGKEEAIYREMRGIWVCLNERKKNKIQAVEMGGLAWSLGGRERGF